jgi:hypothetical protein
MLPVGCVECFPHARGTDKQHQPLGKTWRATFNSAVALKQSLDHRSCFRSKEEDVGLVQLVMPFEQSRMLGPAFGEEHDLKSRLQLISRAVAAALAWRNVHSVPRWHTVSNPILGTVRKTDDSPKKQELLGFVVSLTERTRKTKRSLGATESCGYFPSSYSDAVAAGLNTSKRQSGTPVR